MTESSITVLDLDPPARRMATLVGGVTADQLQARTPCAAYTVGDLLDHIRGLTFAFTAAARESAGVDGSGDGSGDGAAAASGPGTVSAANLSPDWRRTLPRQLDELVAAWKDPAAWEGTAEAGGVTMPADIMGAVALNELVIHGWDLARSTGQPFDCDEPSTRASFALLSRSADGDGKDGLFGSVVEVPADAPLLDRAIGLSGRDPAWMP